MDTPVLKLETGLHFKVAESSVKYYGDYVLFDILVEYCWANEWHYLVQRRIKLNVTQQLIIQEQIALDQYKTIQMDRYYEEGSATNFPEQINPAPPADYVEAIYFIVQKQAKKYFELVILPIYNRQIEDERSLENIRKGLKAILNAIDMSNSFGR